jgi:hypothetical protein
MSDPALSLNFTEPDQLPDDVTTYRAAAWAGARGHYRIAQQLMGLAAALADNQIERARARERIDIATAPMIGQTRTEHPRTAKDAETAIIPAVGSHAPMMCQVCGTLLTYEHEPFELPARQGWREFMQGPGAWRHQDVTVLDDHEPQPVRTLIT